MPLRITKLSIILVFTMTQFASAQLTQSWSLQYDGPAHDTDQIGEMVVDDEGNIVVVGETSQSGSWTDILTAKYDSTGQLLWFNAWGSPTGGNDYGADVSIDAAGNVHVCGYYYGGPAGNTIAVLKYSANGALLWDRLYWLNSGGQAANIANEIVVNSTGDVYVCGYTSFWPAAGNVLLMKYDSAGTLQWTRHWDGAYGGWDQARFMTLDSFENILIAGRTQVAQNNDDIGIWKYDPNGNLLWMQNYAGPNDGWESAQAIGVSSDDAVLVGGQDSHSVTFDQDAVVIRYESDGTFAWDNVHTGPGDAEDQVRFIEMDASDNAFVASRSQTASGQRSMVLTKLTPSGTASWTSVYEEPGDPLWSAAYLDAMTRDAAGNIYMLGHSEHPSEPLAGDEPPLDNGWRFVSFDDDGNERWSHFELNDSDLTFLAATPDGDLVGGGTIWTATNGSDYQLVHYAQDDCNNNGVPDVDDITAGTSPDCNGNGVPDECDILDGTDLDCDGNGIPDSCDIADGSLTDANGTGIPDECEALGDSNGDGVVDITDLLAVLDAWGPCPAPCAEDADGDGVVGILDLLNVLANWG